MKHLISMMATTGFAVLVALMFGAVAFAADCKGLSKTKCESSAACSWVNSYKTKEGKTVDGYCRSKPAKSAKKETSEKKSATKKGEKKS